MSKNVLKINFYFEWISNNQSALTFIMNHVLCPVPKFKRKLVMFSVSWEELTYLHVSKCWICTQKHFCVLLCWNVSVLNKEARRSTQVRFLYIPCCCQYQTKQEKPWTAGVERLHWLSPQGWKQILTLVLLVSHFSFPSSANPLGILLANIISPMIVRTSEQIPTLVSWTQNEMLP